MSDLGVKRGTVQLLPYNKNWAKEFETEKANLMNIFGDSVIAIEHIGSTAIPGMSAKPIIDMNMAIASLGDVKNFINQLVAVGYEHMPNRHFKDRYFFPKGSQENRTHHLNLVEIDSQTAWKNPLLFRDYLRNNTDVRKSYDSLKQELAAKYPQDREKYTEGKSDFVMKVITKASL